MAFNFVVKKKKSVYQIIITRSKLKHFIVEGKKCVNETGERERGMKMSSKMLNAVVNMIKMQ